MARPRRREATKKEVERAARAVARRFYRKWQDEQDQQAWGLALIVAEGTGVSFRAAIAAVLDAIVYDVGLGNGGNWRPAP